MDKSEARAIVNSSIRWMRQALALQPWTIHVVYEHVEGGAAHCKPCPAYRSATIAIDPASHDDEDEVLSSLLHELLHIVHCGFETYRKQVAELTSDQEFNALDISYTLGCENTVAQIVSALETGLGLGPRDLIETAKRKAAADGWVPVEERSAEEEQRDVDL